MSVNHTLFAAEAFGAAMRASGHATATSHVIEEAERALDVAGLAEIARDVRNAMELHRLFQARWSTVIRLLSEAR
jgi:hypothetical protein